MQYLRTLYTYVIYLILIRSLPYYHVANIYFPSYSPSPSFRAFINYYNYYSFLHFRRSSGCKPYWSVCIFFKAPSFAETPMELNKNICTRQLSAWQAFNINTSRFMAFQHAVSPKRLFRIHVYRNFSCFVTTTSGFSLTMGSKIKTW